eukprot:TRINITY_DN2264_c0_g1_i3.p1 TRINITY_DN2264_c0_g1~~TRINITY_DN2264_c0_g1_i3.p1  ORF type:complete len:588 (+),score=166.05 TRINITY_DN2264_c0_g1_i3:240-1766(+)
MMGNEVPSGGSVLIPNFSVCVGPPSYAASLMASYPKALKENELKSSILRRQCIALTRADPDSSPDLPREIDHFMYITSLELNSDPLQNKSTTFGYATSVYKAVNVKNGQVVCLRRIHGFRLINTKCMVSVDQWKRLLHSNVVSLKQVFTTKAFGDQSMVFVYDFYPGAETLMSKHFDMAQMTSYLDPYGEGRPFPPPPTPGGSSQAKNPPPSPSTPSSLACMGGSPHTPLPENVIWTYIIQLTSALRQIHSAGLAYRTLDPTKILILEDNRLLLNCGGIFDILTFDPSSGNPTAAIAHYQQEDLISLGKILLALACNSFLAIQRENLQSSMELVTSSYSSDMRSLIMYLLTNPTRVKSVNDLMPMIGARFYTQLDTVYKRNDQVEAELYKDIESTRLLRVLSKICTIVDRAELNNDYEWAEYGDRYMLKLFRDYVFHQVMENDRPWLDMGHVISCLNKLDAGVPDKICLMSRDEQNVLVVSYQELRRCLEQSFNECLMATKSSPNHFS